MQGVKINDKHIEVIVRQMMKKVEIIDPGDTRFLEEDLVDRLEFIEENDWIFDKKVVSDPGESTKMRAAQLHFLSASWFVPSCSILQFCADNCFSVRSIEYSSVVPSA